MEALTLDGFKKWLDTYGQACEESNPKIAVELFTEHAKYYETPFDDPMIGRAAIYQYWSGAAQTLKNVQFFYEILAEKENFGIARWQAKYIIPSDNRVTLDGVLLAEFDGQEKCSIFREWWHRQEVNTGSNDA